MYFVPADDRHRARHPRSRRAAPDRGRPRRRPRRLEAISSATTPRSASSSACAWMTRSRSGSSAGCPAMTPASTTMTSRRERSSSRRAPSSRSACASSAPPSVRRYVPGDVFDFSPVDIHRVTHAGTTPATTLHAYSPPLRRMGAYLVQPGRHARAPPAGQGPGAAPADLRRLIPRRRTREHHRRVGRETPTPTRPISTRATCRCRRRRRSPSWPAWTRG